LPNSFFLSRMGQGCSSGNRRTLPFVSFGGRHLILPRPRLLQAWNKCVFMAVVASSNHYLHDEPIFIAGRSVVPYQRMNRAPSRRLCCRSGRCVELISGLGVEKRLRRRNDASRSCLPFECGQPCGTTLLYCGQRRPSLPRGSVKSCWLSFVFPHHAISCPF